MRKQLPLLDEVLPVVQFAVANLPPETTPGWPYKSLHVFAREAEALLGKKIDQTTRELLVELRRFAAEAEGYELARGPRVPATTIGVRSLDTAEARAMHELVIAGGQKPGEHGE